MSSVTGEKQTEITERCHNAPIITTKLRKADHTTWWQGWERSERSSIAIENVKWHSGFIKQGLFLYKLDLHIPNDPSILSLGVYMREMKAYIHTEIYTLIQRSFIYNNPKLEIPKYPSVGEWRNARERLLRDVKRLGGEEYVQCIDCDYGFKIHGFWYLWAVLESIPADTKGLLFLENTFLDFPGGTSGKEPTCQCRRHKRHRFHPWVRKIPWRKAWQPTLVILPGESTGRGARWAIVHRVEESQILVT